MSIDPATIPEQILRSEVARRNNALRDTHGGGRPKVKHTCEQCGAEILGTREFREHKPRCQKGQVQ